MLAFFTRGVSNSGELSGLFCLLLEGEVVVWGFLIKYVDIPDWFGEFRFLFLDAILECCFVPTCNYVSTCHVVLPLLIHKMDAMLLNSIIAHPVKDCLTRWS